MIESDLCKTLRNSILEHQNAMQPTKTKISRAKSEVYRLEQLVSGLERDILLAEAAAIALGATVRANRVVGGIAAVAGKTDAAMRVSRMQSELRNARRNLDLAKAGLKELERELVFYVQTIPIVRGQMEREGCELIP